ncbi:MAG: phosphopyruvate hydratase [Patescibacteria group bacterium]|jgi:enolase
MRIKSIKAREILDSRGNPTVEVDLILKNKIRVKAAVPSGASTGKHEAWELRDGDRKRYNGLGVLKAVRNINEIIAPALIGKKAKKQEYLDQLMLKLDGTPNKSRLGANAILGVSLASARAAAVAKGQPLYRYLRTLTNLKLDSYKLPTPMFNLINGGRHAENNLTFQELMVVPKGINKFSEKLRAGAEIFQSLKKVLKAKGLATGVGDEGGYAPVLNSADEALEAMIAAIKAAGYNRQGRQIYLASDLAASEFYQAKGKKYILKTGEIFSPTELINFFAAWTEKYPLLSLEDPLQEDDWAGWQELTKKLGRKLMLVGDDLFATNQERLQKGIENKTANAILIKLNQIGTVSETLRCIELAKKNNYQVVISHRSGETNDDFIADLAVAINAEYIKAGAPDRGERVAKYNKLLEIEKEI